MSRLRVSLFLALVLTVGFAAPVMARVSVISNIHFTSCIATFSASWTGLPAKARTYELFWVSDGSPTEVLLSGTAARDGSIITPNLGVEGSGQLSSLLVFYDHAGRAVYGFPNEEGPIPVVCG